MLGRLANLFVLLGDIFVTKRRSCKLAGGPFAKAASGTSCSKGTVEKEEEPQFKQP